MFWTDSASARRRRHRVWLPAAAGVLISASAQAAPALDAVLRSSLGPLGPRLESEGWSPVPGVGGGLAIGDIRSPDDGQLQVRGADCFPVSEARTTSARDTSISRSLRVEGGLPLGGLAARGRAEGSARVELADPVVVELDMARLRPTGACTELLHRWAEEGRDLTRMTVVQSILVARLQLEGCAELAVGLGGGAAASTAVSRCEALGGSTTVVAMREAPLPTVLSRAGVSLRLAPPPPERARRWRRAAATPCWVDRQCTPRLAADARWAVGTAADLAAADRQARDALLDPIRVRLATAAPATAPARQQLEAMLLEQVQVPARHREARTTTHHSLAVLDRRALHTQLDHRRAALIEQLGGVSPARRADLSPVVALPLLQAARSLAVEAALVTAALDALQGTAPDMPAWARPAALRAAEAELRRALRVQVPAGAEAALLGLAVELAGLTPTAGPAALRLQLDGASSATAPAAAGLVGTDTDTDADAINLQRCTRQGRLVLTDANGPARQASIQSTVASAESARCEAAAATAFDEQVLQAAVRLLSFSGAP